MNLGELVAFLIVLIVSLIGIAGLVVLLDLLLPRLVRRASNTAAKMPIRSALVGFVNLTFFTIVSVAALAIADQAEGDGAAALLRLFAAIVLLILNAFLIWDLTAVARWMGERVLPEASALRQSFQGLSSSSSHHLSAVHWLDSRSSCCFPHRLWRSHHRTRMAEGLTTSDG